MPAFFLYGEPLTVPDERLVHVETIAARSRLHDWNIRPHRHRDLHQLLLIRRGHVALRLDALDAGLRGPGAILVPPDAVHGFRFRPRTEGLVISYDAALARELAATTPALADLTAGASALALDRGALAQTDLWGLGQMLLREYGRAAPGRQAALRGLLGALLANLLRLAGSVSQPAPTRGARDRTLVSRLRAYIEGHLREPVTIARCAAELRCSPATLRRACLGVAGCGPLELLHQRRLLEAQRQLRYTSMPVTQVAYYLGFEDPAYFSRFFTRLAGLSPRAFRLRDGLATEPPPKAQPSR